MILPFSTIKYKMKPYTQLIKGKKLKKISYSKPFSKKQCIDIQKCTDYFIDEVEKIKSKNLMSRLLIAQSCSIEKTKKTKKTIK